VLCAHEDMLLPALVLARSSLPAASWGKITKSEWLDTPLPAHGTNEGQFGTCAGKKHSCTFQNSHALQLVLVGGLLIESLAMRSLAEETFLH